MCFEHNREYIYHIGGYVVKSVIPQEYFRGNLFDYVIDNAPDGEKIDVVVSTEFGDPLAPSIEQTATYETSYMKFWMDDDKYLYYYLQNKYVRLCTIEKKDISRIIIVLNKQEGCDHFFQTELTYVFRDALFTFFVECGNLCLHSCGYYTKNQAVLVTGAPGSGKSTYVRNNNADNSYCYIGEDVNLCRIINGKIHAFGLPFCRINNNVEHTIDSIIFLGESLKRMKEDDIRSELMNNEFSMLWLPNSVNVVNVFSKLMLSQCTCKMVKGYKAFETCS